MVKVNSDWIRLDSLLNFIRSINLNFVQRCSVIKEENFEKFLFNLRFYDLFLFRMKSRNLILC